MDQEQDRSEEPTVYKLARARREGSVARGMDLALVTGGAAFFGYAWLAGDGARKTISLAARRAIVTGPTVSDDPAALLSVAGALLSAAARPMAFLLAAIFATVLTFELVQTGFVFTAKPLKPDFNRLNPGQNMKRLVSGRVLVDTLKAVLKTGAYTAVIVLVLLQVRSAGLPAIADAASLADGMRGALLRLLTFALAIGLGFAIADQLIVRRDFLKKMRMSRREVRREVRDREGDARLKQRRKQLHAEFVKTSQSVRGVRDADILITNPTHFAVGLRYDPKTMTAPTVVARGSNQVALRLKRLAFAYGVTIVENPPLARALFQQGDLARQITETHYDAVAAIYRKLRARQSKPEAH